MLRTKEIALTNFLKELQKEINQMIKSLNAADDQDCESNVTQRLCLKKLKRLNEEIKKTIEQHEHGIWVE